MADWIEKTLGEVTSFIAKGIPPKYTEEESKDTIRVLNQKCNRNFEISYSESRIHDCTQKKVPADKMLKVGDVLINSTGTGTAGRVAQMMQVRVPTTIDGHMILLRASEELDPIYYGYAIKAYQSQIEGMAEGSTGQTEINRRRLQDEVIICYPREKSIQKNIGNFLARIDEKIKTNSAINENLEQQAQALYENIFCIPSDIDTKHISLSALMDYAGGSQPPASEFVFSERDGYIRFVQIRDYDTDSHITYIPDSPKNKLCEEHDIMIARYGASLGRICFGINGAYNVALAKVFPKKSFFREFLRCYLSSRTFYEGINNKGGRSAQAGFNQSDINSFEINFPVDETIVKNFECTVAPMFEQRLQLKKENQHLASLRDTLLTKLMSGEIDVSTLTI